MDVFILQLFLTDTFILQHLVWMAEMKTLSTTLRLVECSHKVLWERQGRRGWPKGICAEPRKLKLRGMASFVGNSIEQGF